MKHIDESIIGRRGNYNIPDNAFAKAIYRYPKNIFIIYPADNDDYIEISNAIDDMDMTETEEVYLSGGEVMFIGSGEEFKKLRTNHKIDCDIYMFYKKTGNAITWLDYNIEYSSDFLKHMDVIKNIYSGEIKF